MIGDNLGDNRQNFLCIKHFSSNTKMGTSCLIFFALLPTLRKRNDILQVLKFDSKKFFLSPYLYEVGSKQASVGR